MNDRLIILILIYAIQLGNIALKSIVLPISINSNKDNDDDNEYRLANHVHSYLKLDSKRHKLLNLSTNIIFGSHHKPIPLSISTLDNHIIVLQYDHHSSSTYSTTDTPVQISSSLTVTLVKDTIRLGAFSLGHMPFIHIPTFTPISMHSSLGLGYHFPKSSSSPSSYDKSYDTSLLYQLKTYGAIDKYILSLSNDWEYPKLILGEYPSNFPLKPTQFNYHTCPLLSRNIHGEDNKLWECSLKGVYIDETMFSYSNNAIHIAFSISGNYHSVSRELFEYIINKHFNESITRRECRVEEENRDEDNYISCASIELVTFEEINLVFGKWSLKYKRRELFDIDNNNDDGGMYRFKIMNNPYKNDKDKDKEWILGLGIISNGNMIQPIFDGQKNELGLIYN